MRARRKNLIVLTCDEMRGDCVGFLGNEDCRTPHLDRFAQRGVMFPQHFAVHGKCVPSRISMLTGRYCHTDGYRTIYQHMPPDEPNLLPLLRRAGYETAVFGLNHAWQTLFDSHTPHEGYADWHSFAGHYHDMAFAEFPVPAPGPGSWQRPELDVGFDYGRRIEGRITGFSDDARTAQAVDYLTKTRDRDRPFYLHVNLSRPHPKYEAPEPYYSMVDRAAIRAFPHDLPANAPLHMRVMRQVRTSLDPPPPEAALREIQAVYYAMIAKVESLIGTLLGTIEAEGLMDDSVVIFTVDHGDFAGQYGLYEKWDTCLADCLLHVPLIVWDQDLPTGRPVDGLSEHVDLLPTICELLDVQADWGVHGQSLLPMVRGGAGKECVFADGGHEAEMWGRFDFPAADTDGNPRPLSGKQITYRDVPETMARAKMARTERWKLVTRLAGGNELYDLAADPWELDNLWGRHEQDADLARVVLDLQQRMIDWCLRTDTDRPFQENVGA